MLKNDTVTACCLIIGNEVLSGRTKDANLGWLAERLTGMGIRLGEARVIPDVEEDEEGLEGEEGEGGEEDSSDSDKKESDATDSSADKESKEEKKE